MATLVLSPSEADGTTEEDGGKKGTIDPCDTRGFEVILTLLTKVVAIYMRFFRISLRGLSLEWVFPWL